MGKFLKGLGKLLLWLLILALILLFAVYLGQGYLVYPGRALYRGESPEWQARVANVSAQGYEPMQLDPEEGATDDAALTIRGLWAQAPGQGAAALLWLHDRHESVTEISHQLKPLRDLKVHVFAMEFRGFGQSRGSPAEEGIVSDAAKVYDYLRNERDDVLPDRIYAGGWGLGGSVAMALAGRRPLAGVIAFEPIPSLAEVLAEQIPFVPLRHVLRDSYDARALLQRGDCPVFAVYAGADPPSVKRALAVEERGAGRVRLRGVTEATADSLLSRALQQGVMEEIDSFLADPRR